MLVPPVWLARPTSLSLAPARLTGSALLAQSVWKGPPTSPVPVMSLLILVVLLALYALLEPI